MRNHRGAHPSHGTSATALPSEGKQAELHILPKRTPTTLCTVQMYPAHYTNLIFFDFADVLLQGDFSPSFEFKTFFHGAQKMGFLTHC